jgi:hypothetical protein
MQMMSIDASHWEKTKSLYAKVRMLVVFGVLWGGSTYSKPFYGVRIMMFNATCNTISFISWQSVLLVEETGVP